MEPYLPRRVARTPRGDGRRRTAFSLLEVQVAFVLLGIGLAGIGPLVFMQLRLARKIQGGFGTSSGLQSSHFTYPDKVLVQPVFCLVPDANPWCGGSAFPLP